MAKPARNDPCPCGSGKKYKHCCLGREERVFSKRLTALLVVVLLVALVVAWIADNLLLGAAVFVLGGITIAVVFPPGESGSTRKPGGKSPRAG